MLPIAGILLAALFSKNRILLERISIFLQPMVDGLDILGKTFYKLLKDSNIKGEISIRFDGKTLKTSRDDIQNWISGIH